MDRAHGRERDRRQGQERRQEQERRTVGERGQAQERRSDQDRRTLERVRDQAKIRELENRWRTYEQAHPESSHAFAKHVDITDQQLATRARDFSTAKYEAPDHATRWRSADAMAVATHGLAHTDEYRRKLADAEALGRKRFTVERPLSKVLGPGWRADVYGRTALSRGNQASKWGDDSTAKCIWQRASDGRWHPLTCYPQPST